MNKSGLGGPGSLEGNLMLCPICQIARLVSITMSVNERSLTMHSCARCETKWWDCDGENVGLAKVLSTARKSA
jgi:Zn-finger nucleic acid-binding protein